MKNDTVKVTIRFRREDRKLLKLLAVSQGALSLSGWLRDKTTPLLEEARRRFPAERGRK